MDSRTLIRCLALFERDSGEHSRGTELSEDDAWRVAAMAGLDEDLKALPMGLHTYISEGATNFSGGQKQRLLIAREYGFSYNLFGRNKV